MNDYASVFRYVPHWRVKDYIELGWIESPAHYAAPVRLVWWPLDKGEPKEPAAE